MQAKSHVSSAASIAGWLCSLLTAAAVLCPTSPDAPLEDGWADLPENVQQELGHAGARYEEMRTKFACLEEPFEADQEDGGRSAHVAYLLGLDRSGAADAVRSRRLRGLKRRKADASRPPPYEWTRIVAPGIRDRLRFQLVDPGPTLYDGTITRTLRWESSEPSHDLRRPLAWSGLVTYEVGTGYFVRVVAVPTYQRQRYEEEFAEYRQSLKFVLAIGGFNTNPHAPPLFRWKRKPFGVLVDDLFGELALGLRAPSRARFVRLNRMETDCGVDGERELLLDLVYSKYREFRVSVNSSNRRR